MSQRLWTVVFALAILLTLPRAGSAGLIEIIAEMSGPKMYGHSYECRLRLDGTWDSCKASTFVQNMFVTLDQPGRDMWLSLGGGYYYSADKTVNGNDYGFGDVQMATFDPILEIESKSWPVDYSDLTFQLYHGVLGATLDVIFVQGETPTFFNAGLKLRPIGVVVPIPGLPGKLKRKLAFDYSFDLRIYPDRFTAEDFGKTSNDQTQGWEVVRSHVFGIRIKT